jgi:hypothetical protein
MTERYWFRPKSFGYGATPVTWEGWLLTLGSVVITGAAILVAILAEMHQWSDRRIYQVICVIVLAMTQFVTIILAQRKTSEDWRWRPWTAAVHKQQHPLLRIVFDVSQRQSG